MRGFASAKLKEFCANESKLNSFHFVFFQCHRTHGSKVMSNWLDQLISCRNEICWIDNSHHSYLGSTGQFRIFRICRNKWFTFLKCYRKLYFVQGDLGTVVFPKFEWCVLWAAIVLLKLNIVVVIKKKYPTKVVIFFWTVVYVRPMCAKTKHEYWKTLDINWKKKISTSPCNKFMLIWFTNAYT